MFPDALPAKYRVPKLGTQQPRELRPRTEPNHLALADRRKEGHVHAIESCPRDPCLRIGVNAAGVRHEIPWPDPSAARTRERPYPQPGIARGLEHRRRDGIRAADNMPADVFGPSPETPACTERAMKDGKPEKLLLWDIDGTLISTGRAGEFALEDSIRAVLGARPDLSGIEIAGRTDRTIAQQILLKYGQEPTIERVAQFLDGYVEALARRLPERRPFGSIYAGIVDILEKVHRRHDLAQGLVTGNMRRGARLKLQHYDVFHYFEFGAFADDDQDRNRLPPFAKARAEARYDVRFKPSSIFVIGDTPHDIACGKAIGARTIGVATGRFSAQELERSGADAVFPDFSDTGAFFDFIDRPGL